MSILLMNMTGEDSNRAKRALLVARGAELRERVSRVRADLRREQDPLPLDAPDAAAFRENDDVLQAIEKSASEELARIDAALERLERGTFTVCASCGAPIEAARLCAVPDASECAECARKT